MTPSLMKIKTIKAVFLITTLSKQNIYLKKLFILSLYYTDTDFEKVENDTITVVTVADLS
jgi:hypothetical protein